MQEVKFSLKERNTGPHHHRAIQVKGKAHKGWIPDGIMEQTGCQQTSPPLTGPRKLEKGWACRSREMTQTERESWLPAELIVGTANPHPERIPHPPSNCGQVLPSSRCFPLALAQVGVIINGPGQERGCLWGIWWLLGPPSAFTAVCSMEFFSPLWLRNLMQKRVSGDCVCYSLVCVSLCDESKEWRSYLGDLLAKAVASAFYLTYTSKTKSKNLFLHK